MPPGAHVEWSGQFEYLQRAAARMVVPVTLVVIFLLLYMNFRRLTKSGLWIELGEDTLQSIFRKSQGNWRLRRFRSQEPGLNGVIEQTAGCPLLQARETRCGATLHFAPHQRFFQDECGFKLEGFAFLDIGAQSFAERVEFEQ
ncbi:MAG TPA: hypothetical protein VJ798_04485 [Rhizomicrobium sp.]|nr:hypothetical protein [Rhizomicrobium sp.]